ncbi:MAG: hypothetical protein JXR07_14790 [Reichenbachiella sp.]
MKTILKNTLFICSLFWSDIATGSSYQLDELDELSIEIKDLLASGKLDAATQSIQVYMESSHNISTVHYATALRYRGQRMNKSHAYDSSNLVLDRSLTLYLQEIDKDSTDLANLTGVKKINPELINGIAECYKIKELNYYYLGQLTQAINYCYSAIRLFRHTDSDQLDDTYVHLATWYMLNGENDSSSYFFSLSKQLAIKQRDTIVLSTVLHNQGNLFKKQGMHTRAVENYLEGIRLDEQRKEYYGWSMGLLSLGQFLREENNDVEGGMKYFHQALSIVNQNDFDQKELSLGTIYQELGSGYSDLEMFDSSKYFYQMALTIASKYDRSGTIVSIYNGMASTYLNEKKYDDATKYAELGLSFMEKGNYPRYKGELLLILAEVKIIKGNWQDAKAYALQSLSLVEQSEYQGIIRDVHYTLNQIYENLENYQLAHDHLKRVKEMDEQILNEENIKTVTRIEADYHFEKDMARANLEVAEQKKKATTMIIVASLMFVILVILYWFYRLKIRTSRKLQLLNNEVSIQKNQLEDLNLEKNKLIGMVAHDLRSPLNSVKGLINITRIEEDETEKERYLDLISSSTERMTDMVNRMLDVSALESKSFNLKMETVDLVSLIKQLMINFQIIAKKKEQKLKLINSSDSIYVEVDKNYFIQVMENLISNAIKYAESNTVINIYIDADDRNIKVTVQDQGQGISQEEQKFLFREFSTLSSVATHGEKSTGLGFSIVKKYVEAMKGKIYCESELGVGSKFILKFKIASNRQ